MRERERERKGERERKRKGDRERERAVIGKAAAAVDDF
jgi:hypothetical protein